MKLKTHPRKGFQSSLENIYKPKKTSELIRIFNNKLKFYQLQAKFFCDSIVRYKYLEILKTIQLELLTREIKVEIFN